MVHNPVQNYVSCLATKLRGNDLASDLNGSSYLVMLHFQGFHLIDLSSNYVTITLFSTLDHLKWNRFQVYFSRAMLREAEHPSSTCASKIILDFILYYFILQVCHCNRSM